jgi:putative endonuclease
MSYVYIIQSTTSGKFYIGYTKDLEKRILQHQEDRGGWTKGKGPWILKYYESFELDSEARKREIQLKKKKRTSFYEYLIQSGPGTAV